MRSLVLLALVSGPAACGSGELSAGSPDGYGGLEQCGNLVDDDGDLAADCEDSDCATASTCSGFGPGGPRLEDCGNWLDDDGNALTDCDDPRCATSPDCGWPGDETRDDAVLVERVCDDFLDDDGDTALDCEDADCASAPNCLARDDAPPEDGADPAGHEQDRGERGEPPAADSCQWATDGVCDEPDLCDPGTDTTDCRNADGGGGGAGQDDPNDDAVDCGQSVGCQCDDLCVQCGDCCNDCGGDPGGGGGGGDCDCDYGFDCEAECWCDPDC